MRKNDLKSPLFLFSLALLLLNDFVLKQAFHNWLTGKISDFAGLYVFAVFWSALIPRYRKQIFFSIGISFIYWKSPLSNPLLSLWSDHVYAISRTVDYSDLFALIVLPFAYFYTTKERKNAEINFTTIIIIFVSLFSFCATSQTYHTVYYNDKYYFTSSPETIEAFLNTHLNLSHREINSEKIEAEYTDTSSNTYLPSRLFISLSKEGLGSKMLLKKILVHSYRVSENEHEFFENILVNTAELGFREKRTRFELFRDLDNFDPMLTSFLTAFFMFVFCLIVFIFNLMEKIEKVSRIFNIISILFVVITIGSFVAGFIEIFIYAACLYFIIAFIISLLGWKRGKKAYKAISATGIVVALLLAILWVW
jgi:hypothetical protein